MAINISSNPIENWFEERLALDQEHKVNPEKRMVRIKRQIFRNDNRSLGLLRKLTTDS